ncbi:GFA family protein [Roseobacter sp. YSTF-M11]|uniref:GFA family protein n=1 Tax=Roseobacter insulae TaxID=2859783 RepID=A0A9X1K4F0_9RHOB|nr:GFA family protein [Roseobacter insulae]MBW4709647.1 GFA family protein [Roseobacter insulae]
MTDQTGVTGRCYCGAKSLRSSAAPHVVAYCHCTDCKRVTGAPVAAFAAFCEADLIITPDPGPPVSHHPGVVRWFCTACGSPLAAQYDYLPGQVYVPIGLLDQAADLEPSLHSHAENRVPWLHIDDDLPRQTGSGRDILLSPPDIE